MGDGNSFSVRALEACTSFLTCDVLDMTYFELLVRRASEHGINTLTLFVIPDSYYPETSGVKTWSYEQGFDWPSDAFEHYRNPCCPNADPEREYLPELISLCHSHGIRVYLRTINNKHRWLFPEYDDWRAISLRPDGSQCTTDACSWDISDFMVYYYRVLEELLQRYATGPDPVDGLILDQQKCFGPYVNAESQARFEQLVGHPMDFSKPGEIMDYWSARNAQRVRETVGFCRAICPTLEIGVTLEALKAHDFATGRTGMKYIFFNLRTTGTDFIHHQIFDHSEAELFQMWEKLTSDGPVWVMLDPTSTDAGWDRQYWGWKPRTPESIGKEFAKIRRIREQLSNPDHLLGVTEFPISRLPLDHANLAAALLQIGGR